MWYGAQPHKSTLKASKAPSTTSWHQHTEALLWLQALPRELIATSPRLACGEDASGWG